MYKAGSVMARLVTVCAFSVATAVALPPGPAAAVAPATEVAATVVSYRTWIEQDTPSLGHDTLNIAGEIRNSSAYRINGYVTVGVTPGRTGPNETLSASVDIVNLAPGQKSPFLIRSDYATGVDAVTVTFITAGGYTRDGPTGAIGLSATSGVQTAPATQDMSIIVQVRNSRPETVVVGDLIATFYDSTGKVVTRGLTAANHTLNPGQSQGFPIYAHAPGTPTSAAVSLNAGPPGSPRDGSIVAWTNYFEDVGASSFRNDIAWIAEQRITSGCAPFRYCPTAPVLRGQMASFLARALGLPSTATDYFPDDDGTTHEADINKIAEAGITSGCGGGNYCPDRNVTRAEMATFLVKALDLSLTTTDYFTDDESSVHEPNINALAESGITSGCGPGLYCPSSSVTREQMAAFLHRAFD